MIDMAQAERTLRRQERAERKLDWAVALREAAKQMGLAHWSDVCDGQIPELHRRARDLQEVAECPPTS